MVKEDLLYSGTTYFAIAFFASSAFLAPYVSSQTKDATLKGSNMKLTVGLNFMAWLCMWSMWICAYMHQMYPLISPEIIPEKMGE